MRVLEAIHDRLGTAPRWVRAVLALVLVAAIWILDYATGPEISASVLYVVPIGLAAWYAGPRWAVTISVVAAAGWFVADVGSGDLYTAQWIPVWNAVVRLAFFLIITDLLRRLHASLDAQREIAETDALTGLPNSRRFLEALRTELTRARRYRRPLSLAYFDLDGFKRVNDTLGHQVGDAVLETVGATMKTALRATDVPGRLGGDEFAVLYPETDPVQVREAVAKMRMALQSAMARREWAVGFSMGVVTALGSTTPPEELLDLADGFMYESKRDEGGKVVFGVTGSDKGPRA